MLKKVLLFFLLCSAPLIIFFLHIFGENQYEIPPLTLKNREFYSYCEDSFFKKEDNKGYNWVFLPKSIIDSIHLSTSKIRLVTLRTQNKPLQEQAYWINFLRVFRYFPQKEKKISTYLISMTLEGEEQARKYCEDLGVHYTSINQFLLGSHADNEKFLICNFRWPIKVNMLKFKHSQIEKFHAILIDNKKKLRGYYNLLEISEVDRLIHEIKILTKNTLH